MKVIELKNNLVDFFGEKNVNLFHFNDPMKHNFLNCVYIDSEGRKLDNQFTHQIDDPFYFYESCNGPFYHWPLIGLGYIFVSKRISIYKNLIVFASYEDRVYRSFIDVKAKTSTLKEFGEKFDISWYMDPQKDRGINDFTKFVKLAKKTV